MGSKRPRMLTERRLVQWPHLTVTVLKRLLQGTLTWKARKEGEVMNHVKHTEKRKKIQKIIYMYSEDSVTEVAMDVAELLGGRRGEVVQRKGS